MRDHQHASHSVGSGLTTTGGEGMSSVGEKVSRNFEKADKRPCSETRGCPGFWDYVRSLFIYFCHPTCEQLLRSDCPLRAWLTSTSFPHMHLNRLSPETSCGYGKMLFLCKCSFYINNGTGNMLQT